MKITEVRIKLADEAEVHGNEQLRAFGSITFDSEFVVRDLKVVEGMQGLFVAMPSRQLTDRCPCCHVKNALRNGYCWNCGRWLDPDRALRGSTGRTRLYADIAHPITQRCRAMIQKTVLNEFLAECERARQPGYVSSYDRD